MIFKHILVTEMSVNQKILENSHLLLLIGVAFLIIGCEERTVQQSSQFVEKNTSFNKSSSKNVDSKSTNENNRENTESLKSNSSSEFSTDKKFELAAAENAKLKMNLAWTFGGKAQTGWYLYEELISRLIESSAKAESGEFAEMLARWQKNAGLEPTGILNETTLMAIVKNWQANRLKIRGYASPDELMVAPPADFYDPSRAEELRQLQRNAYNAYKKMIAAAVADKSLNLASDGKGNLAASEKFLKIISAFRSKEYQEKLRRESPNSGRAGLAVNNSPHFTGRALDIYVGGEPVETRDDNRAVQVQTPVYKWLVKNAATFGFKPYFYEPWHWEYAPE